MTFRSLIRAHWLSYAITATLVGSITCGSHAAEAPTATVLSATPVIEELPEHRLSRLQGYQVHYRYLEHDYQVILPENPGTSLRLGPDGYPLAEYSTPKPIPPSRLAEELARQPVAPAPLVSPYPLHPLYGTPSPLWIDSRYPGWYGPGIYWRYGLHNHRHYR